MPAVDNDGNVDIDNVAVAQLFRARNTMANHVVDRSADGFGEAFVIQWGWNGVMFNNVIVAQLVQFPGRDPGLDMGRNEIKDFGAKLAGAAHAFEISLIMKLDAVAAEFWLCISCHTILAYGLVTL